MLCAIAALVTQWLCGCANNREIGKLRHYRDELEFKVQWAPAQEKERLLAQIKALEKKIEALEAEDLGAGVIAGVGAYAGGGGGSGPDTAARVTATSAHLGTGAAAAAGGLGTGAATVGTMSAPPATHTH